jgi:hypothetical protein
VDESNNQNKNGKKPTGFLTKAGKFIIGKGFYIVLFLCIAAIGISGYVIFYAGKNDNRGLPDLSDIGLETTFSYSTTAPEPGEVGGSTIIPEGTTGAETTGKEEPPKDVKLCSVRARSKRFIKTISRARSWKLSTATAERRYTAA